MPDVKIKGYSGTELPFSDVPKVWLAAPDSTADNPVLVPFTYGEAVDGVEITPDFSAGDMEVTMQEGYLARSAVVKKPETLVPENIAKGTVVAGVAGTHEGEAGGEIEDSIRYFSCVLDPVDRNIELQKLNFQRMYEDTNNYNVSIPETFGGYPVSILSSEGSYGFFNNRTIKNIEIHPNVRYVNNSMVNLFSGCSNFNGPVSIPASVTNIFGMFRSCGRFNHQIDIPNNVVSMAYTFESCTNFNQPVTIPDSVQTLIGTFRYCRNFNQPVTIPNSVTSTNDMLGSCENFNQPVTIPNSVTSIANMFGYCYAFNSPVTFEESEAVNYGTAGLKGAFSGCNTFNQPVVIPDFIVGEMNNTFANCNRLNAPIVIGNGINAMTYAFLNCGNLRSDIIIGTGVTSLNRAFYNAHVAGNVRILSRNVTVFNYAFWTGLVATKNTRLNIFVPAGSATNTCIYNNGTYLRTSSNLSWTTNANNNCRYNAAWNVYVYWE